MSKVARAVFSFLFFFMLLPQTALALSTTVFDTDEVVFAVSQRDFPKSILRFACTLSLFTRKMHKQAEHV